MNASHALNHLVPLASDELNQDKVTPGLLGFVIFAAIAVGLWLLMKNMGKQMKKIDFEERPVVTATERKQARAAAAESSRDAAASGDTEPPRV